MTGNVGRGPGERLGLGFLFDREYDCGFGRIQVEPDDVIGLLDKQWVVGELNPEWATIFDRDQCVASWGVSSSVVITTSST